MASPLSSAELDQITTNVRAVNDWAEGDETTFATMANGRRVPSPSKVIFDARLYKAPTPYSDATIYTDATDTVTESGVDFAPVPAFLPIGPETFDQNKWYIFRGGIDRLSLSADTNINRDTVAAMTADTDMLAGDLVSVEDYATGHNSGVLFFVAVAGAAPSPDSGSQINHNTLSLHFVQNFPKTPTVKMWGAAGNAAVQADDQPSIQKAMDFTRTNLLPLGLPGATYPIASNLSYASDGNSFTWDGAGFQQVTIKATSPSVTKMLEFSDSLPGDTNFVLRSSITGVTFDGNSNADFGIKGFAAHFTIRDCRITRTTNRAIDLGQAFDFSCDNLEIDNCTGDGLVLINSGSNNEVTIYNSKIFLNSGVGIICGSGAAVYISHCGIETNAEAGILLASDIACGSIDHNYFEANASTGYTFTSPAVTIQAEIIINGGGILNLNSGNPSENVAVEDNFHSAGGANYLVYAGGYSYGRIVNNFQVGGGDAKVLGAFGDDGSGGLTNGQFDNITIARNQGYGKTYTGTHTGSSGAANLADSAANLKATLVVGSLIFNETDNSYGIITAATSTTANTTLIAGIGGGGEDLDFDNGDVYSIIVPEIALDNVTTTGTGTALGQGGEFRGIIHEEASLVDAVRTELNQWTLVSAIGGGTWRRSSVVFDENPNVPVWELELLSTGSSDRYGFTINMDDFKQLRGKNGEFSAKVKQPFAGDGNVQLVVNGITPIPSVENANDDFVIQTVNFRFPMTGDLEFSVVKVGVSGVVQMTVPKVVEIGSRAQGLIAINTPVTVFQGTIVPVVGAWKVNDDVYLPAAIGSPRATTCTTAPLTFTDWVNL